jgi:hypothetical protein
MDRAPSQVPLTLEAFPPFDDPDATPFGPPHVLVVGVGQTGSQIVLNSARYWETTLARRIHRLPITLVDRKASRCRDWLALRFPRIEEICDLLVIEMEVGSPEFQWGCSFLSCSKSSNPTPGTYRIHTRAGSCPLVPGCGRTSRIAGGSSSGGRVTEGTSPGPRRTRPPLPRWSPRRRYHGSPTACRQPHRR